MRVVREEMTFRAEPYGVFGGGYTIYLGDSPEPSFLYLSGSFEKGKYFRAGDNKNGVLIFYVQSVDKNEKGEYVGKGVAYKISPDELKKHGLGVLPVLEEKGNKEITYMLLIEKVNENDIKLKKWTMIEPLEGKGDEELIEEPIEVKIVKKRASQKPKM